jgi:TPR repeat protein
VAQDPVMAYVWLSLAAAQGNKDAQVAQQRVAESLNPVQKAQAQQLMPNYFRQYGKPAQV